MHTKNYRYDLECFLGTRLAILKKNKNPQAENVEITLRCVLFGINQNLSQNRRHYDLSSSEGFPSLLEVEGHVQ